MNHSRILHDLQEYINSDICDTSFMYTLCTTLAQFVENVPGTRPNPGEQDLFVVALTPNTPQNLFQSVRPYSFQNVTLDSLENTEYHLFLTCVANIVKHHEMQKQRLQDNVITQYVFQNSPGLSIFLRSTVLDLCYAFATNSEKRTEDLQEAATHLLPFLQRQDFDRFRTICTNFLDKPQLCFTNEATFEPLASVIKHKFVCKLAQKKCAVPDCYTWVDIGLPFCAEHLRTMLHVEIKASTIPNAGLGVFACHPNPKPGATIVFQKHRKITFRYGGNQSSKKEQDERYTDSENTVAPYTLQLQSKKQSILLDGACHRHVSSMMNHAFTSQEKKVLANPQTPLEIQQAFHNAFTDKSFTANCIFSENGDIMALNNIIHGQELLVSYGLDYFRNAPNVHQLYFTKPCLNNWKSW